MNLVYLGVWSQKAAAIVLIAGAAAFLLSALAVCVSRIAALPRFRGMAMRLIGRNAVILMPVRVMPGRHISEPLRASQRIRSESVSSCALRWN
jgi:hypothetical protein